MEENLNGKLPAVGEESEGATRLRRKPSALRNDGVVRIEGEYEEELLQAASAPVSGTGSQRSSPEKNFLNFSTTAMPMPSPADALGGETGHNFSSGVVSTTATTSSASLFAMEESDVLNGDGWGCESPSAILLNRKESKDLTYEDDTGDDSSWVDAANERPPVIPTPPVSTGGYSVSSSTFNISSVNGNERSGVSSDADEWGDSSWGEPHPPSQHHAEKKMNNEAGATAQVSESEALNSFPSNDLEQVPDVTFSLQEASEVPVAQANTENQDNFWAEADDDALLDSLKSPRSTTHDAPDIASLSLNDDTEAVPFSNDPVDTPAGDNYTNGEKPDESGYDAREASVGYASDAASLAVATESGHYQVEEYHDGYSNFDAQNGDYGAGNVGLVEQADGNFQARNFGVGGQGQEQNHALNEQQIGTDGEYAFHEEPRTNYGEEGDFYSQQAYETDQGGIQKYDSSSGAGIEQGIASTEEETPLNAAQHLSPGMHRYEDHSQNQSGEEQQMTQQSNYGSNFVMGHHEAFGEQSTSEIVTQPFSYDDQQNTEHVGHVDAIVPNVNEHSQNGDYQGNGFGENLHQVNLPQSEFEIHGTSCEQYLNTDGTSVSVDQFGHSEERGQGYEDRSQGTGQESFQQFAVSGIEQASAFEAEGSSKWTDEICDQNLPSAAYHPFDLSTQDTKHHVDDDKPQSSSPQRTDANVSSSSEVGGDQNAFSLDFRGDEPSNTFFSNSKMPDSVQAEFHDFPSAPASNQTFNPTADPTTFVEQSMEQFQSPWGETDAPLQSAARGDQEFNHGESQHTVHDVPSHEEVLQKTDVEEAHQQFQLHQQFSTTSDQENFGDEGLQAPRISSPPEDSSVLFGATDDKLHSEFSLPPGDSDVRKFEEPPSSEPDLFRSHQPRELLGSTGAFEESKHSTNAFEGVPLSSSEQAVESTIQGVSDFGNGSSFQGSPTHPSSETAPEPQTSPFEKVNVLEETGTTTAHTSIDGIFAGGVRDVNATGGSELVSEQGNDESVQAADALFGNSSNVLFGSPSKKDIDVPPPVMAIVAEEHELPTSDAGDLFASAAPAPEFGSSSPSFFSQQPAVNDGFSSRHDSTFGGDSSFRNPSGQHPGDHAATSPFGQEQQGYGGDYDSYSYQQPQESLPSANDFFGGNPSSTSDFFSAGTTSPDVNVQPLQSQIPPNGQPISGDQAAVQYSHEAEDQWGSDRDLGIEKSEGDCVEFSNDIGQASSVSATEPACAPPHQESQIIEPDSDFSMTSLPVDGNSGYEKGYNVAASNSSPTQVIEPNSMAQSHATEIQNPLPESAPSGQSRATEKETQDSSNSTKSYYRKPAPKSIQQQDTSGLRMNRNKFRDTNTVPPSCLVSFGFGGNVVTMFPKRKLRLNIAGPNARNSPRGMPVPQVDPSGGTELRKGPVHFYRLDQLHPRDRVINQLDKFPGPLTDGNVTEDGVLKYIEDTSQLLKAEEPEEEDERVLLGVLRVLVKQQGRLTSETPNDPNSPEAQLVAILRESELRRKNSSHPPPAYPQPKPAASTASDGFAQNASKIRDLLAVGNRKGAIDVAVNSQMWVEAILLASFTDKEEYRRLLNSFVTARYFPGDPCRSLYLAMAEQQEKSVHEPQKLLSGPQQTSNSPILPNWVSHAALLVANRAPDSSRVFVELGDRLWKEVGAVAAAHTCYLLAGVMVEAPAPTSRIALVGADHRSPTQARFYVSPGAVQRTEIYEWVQKRVNANSLMVPFQGYKLIYATLLADYGKLETAFKYVTSMLDVIRAVTATMKPGTSMYLEGMQNQLTVLDDRLRQHLGQDRVNSVAAATEKNSRWGLGSALSIVGKIVNRVVEGSDAPGSGSGSAPGSSSGKQPLYPGTQGSGRNSPTSFTQPSPQQFNVPAPGSSTGHRVSLTPPPSSGRKSAPLPPNESDGYGGGQAAQKFSASFERSSSEHMSGPNDWRRADFKRSPSEPSDGAIGGTGAPASDRGSPKSRDSPSKSKSGRSKTPPPSSSKSNSSTGSGSGWFSGISSFITTKMNPDAKVAKLGEQMEAYFDEEKKRWVFPGETQSEEPQIPSAPPTGPTPSPTPPDSSGGPAPNDPLAALMAPPTSRAHAQLMNKDPLAAMMAPPSRPSMYGKRANSMPMKRAPPRPQFAVFKPSASSGSFDTSESDPQSSDPPPSE